MSKRVSAQHDSITSPNVELRQCIGTSSLRNRARKKKRGRFPCTGQFNLTEKVLIALSCFMLLCCPFMIYWYITSNGQGQFFDQQKTRMAPRRDITYIAWKGPDRGSKLKDHVLELERVKASVLRELRVMEQKYHRLKAEILIRTQKLEQMDVDKNNLEFELETLRNEVKAAKIEKQEVLRDNTPYVWKPLSLAEPPDWLSRAQISAASAEMNSMDNSFDYSRCSIAAPFRVFVYSPSYSETNGTNMSLASKAYKAFESNMYVTKETSSACLSIILAVTLPDGSGKLLLSKSVAANLSSNSAGQNHVIVILNDSPGLIKSSKASLASTVGSRAMIAAPDFVTNSFQAHFDFVIPSLSALQSRDSPVHPAKLVPARRRFLLSFIAGFARARSQSHEDLIHNSLKAIQEHSRTSDLFHFDFNCTTKSRPKKYFQAGLNGSLELCASVTYRESILIRSTFTLIAVEPSVDSESETISRFVEALRYGAIPVFLGTPKFPFDEIVDWSRCTLVLPRARITELHFYLRTFMDASLLEMRRNGWILYERHLSSPEKLFDSLLASLRSRLIMPPDPVADVHVEEYFNYSSPPHEAFFPFQVETGEYLGPVEMPFATHQFQRNYSAVSLDKWGVWNSLEQDPFFLYPSTPFVPVLPSEAKFQGSGSGFRPINNGSGGSGQHFSEALGGNVPREQFTVMLLTYERVGVLIESLKRLNNLPYLNKVIVIWNSPEPPDPAIVWPKLTAPLLVIKSAKNSLNNRFLPFAQIETEAVLSLDDDVQLRHDEIVLAFRVWRESRDRIVGFPGRFHAWDAEHESWLYNSNHSCELSMVLTGAAFFHKMSGAIRSFVDEHFNCEDIAMNFLVSHLTRKPPIKVTSRWTFRCPGCPETLSSQESHFMERHNCLNTFVQIYGYNPLLYTQFRVDSVLFKTRLPHNHQKCFKYV